MKYNKFETSPIVPPADDHLVIAVGVVVLIIYYSISYIK